MENQDKLRPGEKIIKASIPDEDVLGWMKVLREGGFTEQELDDFFSRMNDTYRKVKNVSFVENELKKIQQYLKERYGRVLNSKEIEYLKQGIEEKLKEKAEEK